MAVNVWTILFEIVNFLVLAYILYRLLYRPLHEALDRRRRAIQQAEDEARKAREDAIRLRDELERRLAEIELARQQAIREAREQSEAERGRLLAAASREVERYREENRRALEQERESLLEALSDEVTGLAVDAVERLVREVGGVSTHQYLTLRLIETIESLPEDEREQVRQAVGRGEGAVIETARPIDDELFRRLADALRDHLGATAEASVQVDSELIAGLRVRLAGHVWDASVANQLAAIRPADRKVSVGG